MVTLAGLCTYYSGKLAFGLDDCMGDTAQLQMKGVSLLDSVDGGIEGFSQACFKRGLAKLLLSDKPACSTAFTLSGGNLLSV